MTKKFFNSNKAALKEATSVTAVKLWIIYECDIDDLDVEELLDRLRELGAANVVRVEKA